MDPRTQIGPLVSRAQQQRVLDYLKIGVEEGAAIVAQARTPDDPKFAEGYFVPPTLFADVKPEMRIAQEEIFGPVTGVITFDEPEEGIAIANNSSFGLVGVVYSPDFTEAMRAARKLDVGCVYVNNFYRFGFECVPFGGTKASGYGRERSLETLREFAQMKTIKTLSGLGDIPVWSFMEEE
jgi:acyl-CoA reductase-like NAD-dependent aldehyde dehydrogenase